MESHARLKRRRAMRNLPIRADLHNHSCLSPCADLSMSPSRMAEVARERQLDLMAITDHNATLNCPAFAIACAKKGIIPLFGLELNSSEEVHLLALFATPREALVFGAELYPLIPALAWDSGTFGDQAVVDEDENVLELHGRWLGAAMDATFGDLAENAHASGALVIPAHVDRGMFSVYSQLGFLPPGPYDAVESIGPVSFRLTGGLCALSGSDAHYPEHIGRRPFLVELPEPSVGEMREALEKYAQTYDAERKNRKSDEEFEGYADLLSDPLLDLYPEKEARALFADLGKALRGKKITPTHTANPLVGDI
ncbi:MAG TPA: PHP domain-containing protein [Rectinemataceae bacterium]|nr:PHP domain-containing protein [Rectinemataceae bacterium]